MPKQAGGAVIPLLQAGAESGSRRGRVYRTYREAILQGTLAPGARLPSSRVLAGEYCMARMTVEDALEQLAAEGFVERYTGRGTFVTRNLPEGLSDLCGERNDGNRRPAEIRLSKRGKCINTSPRCEEPLEVRPFDAGLPAVSEFPLAEWNRLLQRSSRKYGRRLLGYMPPAGFEPLREAIAAYLKLSRGVSCSPGQVVVLTSSQQALDIAARMLLDHGDAVAVEDPVYPGARGAFVAGGAVLQSVGVDESGMRVAELNRMRRIPKLVYVTPSHQYPLGATLNLERRLELLNWADTNNVAILEDDYDSEFRYEGRPIAALQGLDQRGRVIYIGTFSKAVFPAMRVAYAVVPEGLVDAFVAARINMDGHTAALQQATLFEFMSGGQFATHLRRMRSLYKQRRDILVAALSELEGEGVQLGRAEAGFHCIVWLPQGIDDHAFSLKLRDYAVQAKPLSKMYVGRAKRAGLLLSFGDLAEDVIHDAARRFIQCYRAAKSRR
ncbi:MAG: PLP-dependent aminotransferase family protein [Gammaproteobacteria bacterium]|nr:PLP-dependent aminotransferase family protein [Gammaproteobacteria bacterium]